MNKRRIILQLITVILTFLVVGCSTNKPTVSPHAPQSQKLMLTTQHWGSLADRVAEQVVLDFIPVRIPSNSTPASSTPASSVYSGKIFVADLASDMKFSRAFVGYLKRSLMNKGVKISNSPAGATILNFRVQSFLTEPESSLKKYPFNTATFWTTLAAFGWIAADASISNDVSKALLLGSGPLIDYLKLKGETTNAEIILTATVEGKNETIFSYIEEFYIQPSDLHYYWTDFPPGALAVSPGTKTVTRIRPFKITQ